MAFALTSNYAGDAVATLFTLMDVGNELFEGGFVHIEENIAKSRYINNFQSGALVQSYAATPSSSGTFTKDEKDLTPDPFLIYQEFDPNDFDDDWDPFQGGGNSPMERTLAPEVEAGIIELVLGGTNGIGPYMGKNLWQGDLAGSDPDNKFDGYRTKAAADGDVVDIVGMTLTEGNVLAELEKVWNAVPTFARNQPSFFMAVSVNTHDLYGAAIEALANKGQDPSGEFPVRYRGKPLVAFEGMQDDEVIATYGDTSISSNLWVGFRDLEEASIKIMPVQNNSVAWFVRVDCAVDTNFKFGEHVVYYT